VNCVFGWASRDSIDTCFFPALVRKWSERLLAANRRNDGSLARGTSFRAQSANWIESCRAPSGNYRGHKSGEYQ
jgi:hypothetical protein